MNELTTVLSLADGTRLEGSCGFSDRSLWCWISGRTMADCFSLFSDSEKTKLIDSPGIKTGIRYKGFTVLELIKTGTDAFGRMTIDVRLTWPEGGEHSIEKYPMEPEEEEGGAE